jgi:hypothetical protein
MNLSLRFQSFVNEAFSSSIGKKLPGLCYVLSTRPV